MKYHFSIIFLVFLFVIFFSCNISLKNKSYTITFEPNNEDVQGSTNEITAVENTTIILTACGFIREGYTFTNWNTKSDGTGISYADKASVKLTSNLTLFAQWKENPKPKYTVLFDANAENVSGTTEIIEAEENTTVILTACGFIREGYTFTNWNTKSDGTGISYADKASVKLTSNLTLFAQWVLEIEPTYSITVLPFDHGTVTVSKTEAEAGTEITITLTPDQYYAVDTISITDSTDTGIQTSYSQLQENVYTFTMPEKNVSVSVAFKYVAHNIIISDVQHGTVTVNKQIAVEGDNITVTLMPEEYYAVESISVTDVSGNVIQVNSFQSQTNIYNFEMAEQDIKIYVTFKYIAHSIKVKLYRDTDQPNGRVTVNTTTAIKGSKITITVTPDDYYKLYRLIVAENVFLPSYKDPVVEGYINEWWTNNASYEFIMPDNDVCIWACFQPVSYNIAFNTDCSTIIQSQNVERGSTISRPLIQDNTECSGFIDWYTEPECINAYDFNTPVTQDLTLYAKWERFITTEETFSERLKTIKYSNIIKICHKGSLGSETNVIKTALNELYESQPDFGIKLELAIEGEIGYKAFSDCKGIKQVTVCDCCTKIYLYAFIGCTGLSEVKLPENINIGSSTFKDCTSLSSVSFSRGVKIGAYAFEGCTSLSSVSFPEGVEIDAFAFKECSSLTDITISSGVLLNGSNIFMKCKNLKNVTFNGVIEKIGDGAFSECSSLTNIELPDGVTEIGNGAFYNCKSLKNITIPETVTKIGQTAFRFSGISSVKIPKGVTVIEKNTFWNCNNLTSVIIPNGVTKIEESAFRDCRFLNSINIPNSVTEIHIKAFYCEYRRNVTVDQPNQTWFLKETLDGDVIETTSLTEDAEENGKKISQTYNNYYWIKSE